MPRCSARVLRQLVGRRAALDVTADAQPLPLDQALALAGPNRLAWCLVTLRGDGIELRWLLPGLHRDDCRHQHVLDHQCQPGTPARPLRTRTHQKGNPAWQNT